MCMPSFDKMWWCEMMIIHSVGMWDAISWQNDIPMETNVTPTSKSTAHFDLASLPLKKKRQHMKPALQKIIQCLFPNNVKHSSFIRQYFLQTTHLSFGKILVLPGYLGCKSKGISCHLSGWKTSAWCWVIWNKKRALSNRQRFTGKCTLEKEKHLSINHQSIYPLEWSTNKGKNKYLPKWLNQDKVTTVATSTGPIKTHVLDDSSYF